MSARIRPFALETDEAGVVQLWRHVFGYETAHNDPRLAIAKKLALADGLLFVAVSDAAVPGTNAPEAVVGTTMAGYDGHRGWLYSVAVHPSQRRSGLGSALVCHAEQALAERGCMKVNLQLLASNEATVAFYQGLGYAVEPRISMGKVLHQNVPGKPR